MDAVVEAEVATLRIQAYSNLQIGCTTHITGRLHQRSHSHAFASTTLKFTRTRPIRGPAIEAA